MRKQSTIVHCSHIIILVVICNYGFCSNTDDARKVLQSYFTAACINDTNLISSIVTDAAHGTGYVGLRAYYYDKYRGMLDENFVDEHVVLDCEKSEDYLKFLVSDPWLNGQKRWFFLVLQDSTWKIAAPWEVLSKNYHRVETEHFIVYWSDETSFVSPHLDIAPSEYSLSKLEELYGRICSLLQYEMPYKIEYYICASDEQPELFTEGIEGKKHQGHNSMDSRLCFAVHPYNAHVVIHAISITAIQEKTPPHPTSILREGLATAFQWPDARIGHVPSVMLVKNMLEENTCPTLDSVICCYEKIPFEKNYPISATFVLYLIEEFGEEKLRRLWYNHPHNDVHAFIDTLELVCEAKVSELDSAWRDWVIEKTKKMDVPIEYECNQVLTANWQRTATHYFVIHHKPHVRLIGKDLQQLDSLYDSICKIVSVEPADTIAYYKCSDFNEMYFMFGIPNWYGGLASEKTIVSLKFPDSYQIAFSLLSRLNCTYCPVLVGSAFHLGCDDITKFAKTDSTIRILMNTGVLIPLDTKYETIVSNRSKRRQFLNQWSSFCRFLIDEYGIDKYVSAIRDITDHGKLIKNIERMYLTNLVQLEKQWKAKLQY